MIELLIAFTVSVITSTLWLIILTTRIRRNEEATMNVAIEAARAHHRLRNVQVNAVDASKIIGSLRAHEALRQYETKAPR